MTFKQWFTLPLSAKCIQFRTLRAILWLSYYHFYSPSPIMCVQYLLGTKYSCTGKWSNFALKKSRDLTMGLKALKDTPVWKWTTASNLEHFPEVQQIKMGNLKFIWFVTQQNARRQRKGDNERSCCSMSPQDSEKAWSQGQPVPTISLATDRTTRNAI